MGNRGFDLDLEEGLVGEELLKKVLGGKVEVKTDSGTFFTNNVVVETRSRGNDSGINVTTADWWAFVLSGGYKGEVIVMIKTDRLKELIAKGNYPKPYGGDDCTSDMYKIPVKDLLKKCF